MQMCCQLRLRYDTLQAWTVQCMIIVLTRYSQWRQVRPNTLEPALMRLKSSGEFSLEGYRSALGIPQLVRFPCLCRRLLGNVHGLISRKKRCQ